MTNFPSILKTVLNNKKQLLVMMLAAVFLLALAVGMVLKKYDFSSTSRESAERDFPLCLYALLIRSVKSAIECSIIISIAKMKGR